MYLSIYLLMAVEAVVGEGALSAVSVVLAGLPLQVLLVFLYVDLLVGTLRYPHLGGNHEVALLPAVRTTSPGEREGCCDV